MDWIHLAQGTVQWLTVVNPVMNVWVRDLASEGGLCKLITDFSVVYSVSVGYVELFDFMSGLVRSVSIHVP